MKIDVELKEAAHNGSTKPVVREVTRMAILGECLHRMGHDVRLCHAPHEFDLSGRAHSFTVPFGGLRKNADVRVVASECTAGKTSSFAGAVVRYKTRVNCRRDGLAVRNSDIFMAHEVDEEFAGRHDVLSIPFIVGDGIIEHMIRSSRVRGGQFLRMFEAYLTDDLRTLRNVYLSDVVVTDNVGFLGFKEYGRSAVCRAVASRMAHDIELYENKPLGPVAYLQRTGSWAAGLCPEGVTPKCNRFSELAMMGVPIVMMEPERQPLKPMLAADNCVVLGDMHDVQPIRDAIKNRAAVVSRQDECYKTGWSPLGQARQLTRKLELLG